MYEIVYTKKAVKDIDKIKQNALTKKVKNLIEVIKENPLKISPQYEKLLGNLERCIFKTY